MPDTTRLLSQVYFKLDGRPANEAFMHNILETTVENSLHLPDVATLTLNDAAGTWVDDANLAPGKTLVIEVKIGDQRSNLFDGEIVEIESDFVPGNRRTIVRAFDRLHRLARGRQVRSFNQVTDGDIVKKIAGECSLTAKCGITSTVHEYVLQDNVTNLDFLRARAAQLGYLLWVQAKELHFEPLGTKSATLELEYGDALREFHPRLTTIDQINTAIARGWDPDKRVEIVGQATSAKSSPQVGVSGQGGDVARSAFGMKAEVLVADRPIRTQVVADKLAQATIDRRVARFIEAEGVAAGAPALGAGVSVKLTQLGSRFSGTYFVTGATHSYDADGGYATRFNVSGFQPATLLSLLATERDGAAAPRDGLVIGVVTDNNDPNGLCRVKVKFPWLSSDHASNWARLVTPGGGPQRGLEFVPEVNDEVLIGFEQGNVNYPYVLGGLWNAKDAPPRKTADVLASGKVKQRVIRSRTGHIITLDDSDDQPSITIVDNTGKNTIKVDSKSNKLTVHFEGDMFFEAPNGDVNVKGKTVTLEATNAFKIKGQSVETEAQQALKMKGMNTDVEATSAMNVKGMTTDVKASTKLGLDGGPMAELKGGMVKIN